MEEIGKIYGGFILEGIAVISLMLFLWCGISVGGDNKSILRIMGENMIIEEANYDLYSDFRSVYDKESRKTAPIIKYAAGALDTGIVNLAETIKATDYKGDELAIKVLSVRNMEGEELIKSDETDISEIILEHAGIYTVLVKTTDDGNRTTQCSIKIPVNRVQG